MTIRRTFYTGLFANKQLFGIKIPYIFGKKPINIIRAVISDSCCENLEARISVESYDYAYIECKTPNNINVFDLEKYFVIQRKYDFNTNKSYFTTSQVFPLYYKLPSMKNGCLEIPMKERKPSKPIQKAISLIEDIMSVYIRQSDHDH